MTIRSLDKPLTESAIDPVGGCTANEFANVVARSYDVESITFESRVPKSISNMRRVIGVLLSSTAIFVPLGLKIICLIGYVVPTSSAIHVKLKPEFSNIPTNIAPDVDTIIVSVLFPPIPIFPVVGSVSNMSIHV